MKQEKKPGMRIMYGFSNSEKTVYSYMTLVDLFNVQICNYDGDSVIYAEVEVSTPNNFDLLYEKILEQARAKGYDVNNICFVNGETGKEVKSYD